MASRRKTPSRATEAASEGEARPRSVGQHHGDLQRALREAALVLVEEGGTDKLSLRAVARRAGVSPAAPYHHFADKEALLAAVAEEGFVRLGDAITDALAGASVEPRERLETMVATYVRFAVQHPTHYAVMFEPRMEDVERHPALNKAAMAAFMRLADAVAAVTGDGEHARHDAAMAWALSHGVVQFASRRMMQQLLDVDADDIDAVAARTARSTVRWMTLNER
jgi:AcrR family transcriptional regulator